MLKQKLLTFALVLVGVLMALGLQMHFLNRAADVALPSALQPTPDGELGVLLGSELLRLDGQGTLLRRTDLGESGYHPIGDIAFLPDGDWLFYHRAQAPGLGESVQRFFRQRHTEHRQQHAENGLIRCTPQLERCRLFSNELPTFAGAFHLSVGPQGHLYIADTSRFVLYKLTPDGQKLATSDGDWHFPNALAWRGDELYLANTNRHRIERIASATDRFGESLAQHLAIAPDDQDRQPAFAPQTPPEEHRYRWPASQAFFDDHWWVLVADPSMANARLVRYDADWQQPRIIHSSGLGDAIALRVFDGHLLTLDWEDGQIKRLAPGATRFRPWGDEALRGEIAERVSQRQRWRLFSHFAIAFMGLVLMIGLVAAWRLDRAEKTRRADAEKARVETLAETHGEVFWLDNQWAAKWRKMQAMHLLMVAGLIAIGVFISLLGEQPTAEVYLMLWGTIPLVLCSLAVFRAMANTRIGVDGEHLMIAQGDKRAHSREHTLRSTAQLINIGSLVVPLGNEQMPMYSKAELERWVKPRLASAEKLSTVQMCRLYWEQRHPIVFLMIYTVVFLAVAYAFL